MLRTIAIACILLFTIAPSSAATHPVVASNGFVLEPEDPETSTYISRFAVSSTRCVEAVFTYTSPQRDPAYERFAFSTIDSAGRDSAYYSHAGGRGWASSSITSRATFGHYADNVTQVSPGLFAGRMSATACTPTDSGTFEFLTFRSGLVTSSSLEIRGYEFRDATTGALNVGAALVDSVAWSSSAMTFYRPLDEFEDGFVESPALLTTIAPYAATQIDAKRGFIGGIEQPPASQAGAGAAMFVDPDGRMGASGNALMIGSPTSVDALRGPPGTWTFTVAANANAIPIGPPYFVYGADIALPEINQ